MAQFEEAGDTAWELPSGDLQPGVMDGVTPAKPSASLQSPTTKPRLMPDRGKGTFPDSPGAAQRPSPGPAPLRVCWSQMAASSTRILTYPSGSHHSGDRADSSGEPPPHVQDAGEASLGTSPPTPLCQR